MRNVREQPIQESQQVDDRQHVARMDEALVSLRRRRAELNEEVTESTQHHWRFFGDPRLPTEAAIGLDRASDDAEVCEATVQLLNLAELLIGLPLPVLHVVSRHHPVAGGLIAEELDHVPEVDRTRLQDAVAGEPAEGGME